MIEFTIKVNSVKCILIDLFVSSKVYRSRLLMLLPSFWLCVRRYVKLATVWHLCLSHLACSEWHNICH